MLPVNQSTAIVDYIKMVKARVPVNYKDMKTFLGIKVITVKDVKVHRLMSDKRQALGGVHVC